MPGPNFKFPVIEGETFIERRNRLGRLRYRNLQAQKKDIKAGLIPDKSKNTSKGAAIAVLEFLKGDLYRTSLVTGVEVRVLNIWREEFGTQKVIEGISNNNSTTDILNSYVECLAVLGLQKAAAGSLADVNAAMEVAYKLLGRREPTRKPPEPSAAPLPEASGDKPPAEEPAAPVMTEESQKAKWERIVRQSISDSRNRDTPMTRNEAIVSLIAQRPEAAAYLSPAPTEVEQPEEDEDTPGYSN